MADGEMLRPFLGRRQSIVRGSHAPFSDIGRGTGLDQPPGDWAAGLSDLDQAAELAQGELGKAAREHRGQILPILRLLPAA